jgi:transcriptional regulator with XRE-family HTH domain
MPSISGRQQGQESGSSIRVRNDDGETLTGPNPMPCTIRDVARLDGVSTATVSRVMSGSADVSVKTATRVLPAISQLQYCPNALAAELRRGSGGIPRKRTSYRPSIARMETTQPSDSGAHAREMRIQIGQISLLEKEYSRAERTVAKLSKNLEIVRTIIQLCKRTR